MRTFIYSIFATHISNPNSAYKRVINIDKLQCTNINFKT